MQTLMSTRENTPRLSHPFLHTIWYVNSDDSYSVVKRSLDADFYVAIRTLSGMGQMDLQDGTVLHLKANSLYLVNQRAILNYCTRESSWQFYWIEFEMDSPAPALLGRLIFLPVTSQEQVELDRCFRSLNRNSLWECHLAEAMFSCLLADWQLRAGQNSTRSRQDIEILLLLEQGRRERTSIAALARQAGMCERSFRDAVQKATGFSPKEYTLRREMMAAMELLKTSTMTVAEIAELFQYKNPFYFSRAFKKHYGISPQQVRTGIKKNISTNENNSY